MISESLAPSLLIAMPQLVDPNFSRAVVLLCRHDLEGSMGLVINRPMASDVSVLLETNLAPQGFRSGMTAWSGGPVDRERGWLLLGFKPDSGEFLDLGQGIYLSASRNVLRSVLASEHGEDKGVRFLLGYAGWGPHQLEAELSDSAWLSAPLQRALVFSTPAEKLWDSTIRSLGVDPSTLALGAGVH